MVNLMGSFRFTKVEDFAEQQQEEYEYEYEYAAAASLSKRPRLTSLHLDNQQREYGVAASSAWEYNPVDEPSPLGLRLKKTPSLLDLIQMKLSHSSQGSSASVSSATARGRRTRKQNEVKGIASSSTANDKLKASNFPALSLRIGTWEYASKYEGDLVVKFYFAKHKLVWEVLEGGLKSKIEIQWSDITALKAHCPENGPSTLTLVLARQPVFFRETNPQPRKHTLWQATSDFTDGQASTNKMHYVQCPPGLLEKHYEKLIQCDVRLRFLSQQPEKVMCSLYFETQASVLENSNESNDDGYNQLQDSSKGTPSSVFDDASSSAADQFSSFSFGNYPVAADVSKDVLSPSSVMDTHAIEGNRTLGERCFEGRSSWENSEYPELRSSSNLMNHFADCISEQMTSDKASECQDMVDDIAQVLLSDTQAATSLDERSLMKKVNSLCCLLQDPVTTSNAHVGVGNHYESAYYGNNISFNLVSNSINERVNYTMQCPEGHFVDWRGGRQGTTIPQKDSLGDLFHLPRVASRPKFLFGIEEDDNYHAM